MFRPSLAMLFPKLEDKGGAVSAIDHERLLDRLRMENTRSTPFNIQVGQNTV